MTDDYARLAEDKTREFQHLVEKSEIFCSARRLASMFFQCALDGKQFAVDRHEDFVAKFKK